MNPGISIIIPTYNREKFVGEAIESVLQQAYPGQIEIIVSDDGSTDKTIEIAKSYGDKVLVASKPENCRSQGVAANRNRGIKMATQPLVAFLDSDDFYLPGHLQQISETIQRDPSLGFAFCRMLELKETQGKKLYRAWTHSKIFKSDIGNIAVSRSNVVHTNGFVFKREVFEKTGLFNESYSNGEDTDLWMRISEQYRGAFSDHFGAVYRLAHNMGQLTKNAEAHIKQCYIDIHQNAIDRYRKVRMKNSFRLFKLKQWLLIYECRQKRWKYYPKYFLLILRFPKSFITALPAIISEYKEKKNARDWQDLDHFLK